MIKISKPSIGKAEKEAINEVLDSEWLGMGPRSRQFEEECRQIIRSKHFLALSSGSRALEVALIAAACRRGDEVLVPALNYAAPLHVILNLGLVPVFVDADKKDGNICIDDVLRKITAKTRFILPVHFRGRSCNMEALLEIADQYGLRIVEDAAHAFASSYCGKYVGEESYLCCFSFGPIKNITCGSGGGIATSDDDIARFIVNYRNMGISRSTWERFDELESKTVMPWDYQVLYAGGRCHLPEINAALGLAQLQKLDALKKKKQRIIQTYQAELSEVAAIDFLHTDPEADFLYIYPILVPRETRNDFMGQLLKKGIQTAIHYPAVHQQPFFRKYSSSGLEHSELLSQRLVTLPSYNDLGADQQAYVIQQVKAYFK